MSKQFYSVCKCVCVFNVFSAFLEVVLVLVTWIWSILLVLLELSYFIVVTLYLCIALQRFIMSKSSWI